jgi:hypothetical protein
MTSIITKLRYLINDGLITTGRQAFDFLSIASSKIFTLDEANVSAVSIKVYKNGVEWDSDNYTYDADTIQITVVEESGEELEVSDTLLATFSYYKKYSDTELKNYIYSALSHLTVGQYTTFSVDTAEDLDPVPTAAQEHLIAVVAAIIIGGNIRSYKTPEITVVFNDNLSLDAKIQQVVRKFNKAYGVLKYIDPTLTAFDPEVD